MRSNVAIIKRVKQITLNKKESNIRNSKVAYIRYY